MPFLGKRETIDGTTYNIVQDLPPNGYLYGVSVAVRDSNNIQSDSTIQILLSNIVADDVTRCYNLQSVDLTEERYEKGVSWTGKIPFGLHQQVRVRLKDVAGNEVVVLKVLWDRN